jgi:hypothetical protein
MAKRHLPDADVARIIEMTMPECHTILREALDKIWKKLGPDREWERHGKDKMITLILVRELLLRRAIVRHISGVDDVSDVEWFKREVADWNDEVAEANEADGRVTA